MFKTPKLNKTRTFIPSNINPDQNPQRKMQKKNRSERNKAKKISETEDDSIQLFVGGIPAKTQRSK